MINVFLCAIAGVVCVFATQVSNFVDANSQLGTAVSGCFGCWIPMRLRLAAGRARPADTGRELSFVGSCPFDGVSLSSFSFEHHTLTEQSHAWYLWSSPLTVTCVCCCLYLSLPLPPPASPLLRPHAVGKLRRNRHVYPALMEAAMAEPLNATDVAPSISSIRELIGVRPNPRL